MSAVRRDVSTLGPGWNKTLEHYALAVRELDSLPMSDRTSWTFLAAMHGIDPDQWITERAIADVSDIPDDILNQTYGDQCQHGSWYFLPWHRGYLHAFEAIIAATVKRLTGDDDWALPYWNYLDDSNPDAMAFPGAFLEDTLPNGDPNPLRKYRIDAGDRIEDFWGPTWFGLGAMDENDFLVGADGSIGFGGGVTGNFSQGFGRKGDLETNPHDTVHGMVGGVMGDPLTAGLHPIFWLHHCNIDRLWEAWMQTPGKHGTRDARWLDGPADRRFIMPKPDGSGEEFTARDTLAGGKYYPTYDDLTKGTGVTPGAAVVAGINMGPAEEQQVEVIGASGGAILLEDAPLKVQVDLDAAAAASGVVAMGATSPGETVARLYLKLDEIRGEAPSPVIDIYVDLPAGADPKDFAERRVARLTLFGLNVASRPDGGHVGNGLGYTLDITPIVDRLSAAGTLNPAQIAVTVVPAQGIAAEAPVSIGRIAVLKRTGTVR